MKQVRLGYDVRHFNYVHYVQLCSLYIKQNRMAKCRLSTQRKLSELAEGSFQVISNFTFPPTNVALACLTVWE